jgi:hypothetical protein
MSPPQHMITMYYTITCSRGTKFNIIHRYADNYQAHASLNTGSRANGGIPFRSPRMTVRGLWSVTKAALSVQFENSSSPRYLTLETQTTLVARCRRGIDARVQHRHRKLTHHTPKSQEERHRLCMSTLESSNNCSDNVTACWHSLDHTHFAPHWSKAFKGCNTVKDQE